MFYLMDTKQIMPNSIASIVIYGMQQVYGTCVMRKVQQNTHGCSKRVQLVMLVAM